MTYSHGITFGEKHSYRDFGLILIDKEIGAAEPKTELIEVNGRDGALDVTSAITPKVKYKNRTHKFHFWIDGTQTDFFNIEREISNYLHGQYMKVICDDDKAFFWYGRCKVNNFTMNPSMCTFTVEMDAEPYKYDVNEAGSPWRWDSFSFVDGVIYSEKHTINGTTSITLPNRIKTETPTVVSDAVMTVEFEGKTYDIKVGSQKLYGIKLREGNTTLVFNGNGEITISYKSGDL